MRQHRRLKVPTNTHRVVRRLFEECNAQKMTLQDLGERSGIAHDTLGRWRRRSPFLLDVEAALNVLGLELSVRHKKDD